MILCTPILLADEAEACAYSKISTFFVDSIICTQDVSLTEI